ncbi:hypothetical protein A1QO_02850 [Vibrio genomosp. F10 str. ZF-129]|uniref:Uncharacterized protein n=1 Tax=Vibrio genomosp. F10 str. ZF-129 TaxID=1187848 RepID=A0A1E5BKP8_9VIBR|nr:hypothetical protein [Vibrio genomosp. F10]OEE38335.1 hypothetical protein A1QO_02850 [Vibrio genomosp. F10 str. ZF-129]
MSNNGLNANDKNDQSVATNVTSLNASESDRHALDTKPVDMTINGPNSPSDKSTSEKLKETEDSSRDSDLSFPDKTRLKKVGKIIIWLLFVVVVLISAISGYLKYKEQILSFIPAAETVPQSPPIQVTDLEKYKLEVSSQLETLRSDFNLKLNGKANSTFANSVLTEAQQAKQEALRASELADEAQQTALFANKTALSARDKANEFSAALDLFKSTVNNKLLMMATSDELESANEKIWNDVERLLKEREIKNLALNDRDKSPSQQRQSFESNEKMNNDFGINNVGLSQSLPEKTEPAPVRKVSTIKKVKELDGVKLYNISSIGGKYHAHIADSVVLNFFSEGDYLSSSSNFYIKAIRAGKNGRMPQSILVQHDSSSEVLELIKVK